MKERLPLLLLGSTFPDQVLRDRKEAKASRKIQRLKNSGKDKQREIGEGEMKKRRKISSSKILLSLGMRGKKQETVWDTWGGRRERTKVPTDEREI